MRVDPNVVSLVLLEEEEIWTRKEAPGGARTERKDHVLPGRRGPSTVPGHRRNQTR